jgi:hypothetical protein
MKIKHAFALISVALLISACESTVAYKKWAEIYKVPVGSKVILHQQLSIGPRRTQSFVQDGEQAIHKTFGGGYDQYYPFCYFEVIDVVDRTQTVEPDTFTIIKISRYQTDIVQTPGKQSTGLSSGDDDGGPPPIVDMNMMYLESATQPNVKLLACASGFDDPFNARLPTIEEIRQSLGAVATLELSK